MPNSSSPTKSNNRQRIESFNSHSSQKSKYRSLIQLRKDIGVIEGASIIIGIIVGSGIFVSPVGVLRYTGGSAGMSLMMWLTTGLFSLTGALVWAELGSTIPRSGGEYIYILKTFGPVPGFACLWITFGLIGAVSTAANSMIFAQYVMQLFFMDCAVPHWAVMSLAVLGILTLSAINCYNVSWATKMATFFTICKVAALLIIIVIGAIKLYQGNCESFNEPFGDYKFNAGSLAMAFYQGFWAYSGWNYLNFLTNEMKNPEKNLPLSIIISLILVTAIYLLTNVAYLAVLTPQEMLDIGSSSTAVAVHFADKTMGVMSWIMPLFVGISVFGSMNAEILSLSRLTHTGAEEKQLPAILSMVSYRHLTPIPAIIIIAILTIIFQLYQDAFYLIELMGFAFCVIAAMCVTSLLYLRYRYPELNRPLKLPIIIPVLFLIVDLFIGGLTIYQQPYESLLSILMMIGSFPVYLIFIAWKNKPKTMTKFLFKATINLQNLLVVVPQDIEYDNLEFQMNKYNKNHCNGNSKTNGLLHTIDEHNNDTSE